MSHTAILTALPFFQYIGAGLPLFILLYIFFISLYLFYQLSQPPPLSIFHGSKQKLYKKRKRSVKFAACHLMIEKSSKNFALLAGNNNTWKLKTTAKLNYKRISIATVRDLYIPKVCHLPDPRFVALFLIYTDYL